MLALIGEKIIAKIQNLLSRRPVIIQILRFVAIGALNTSLDFIIYNFVSKYFGVYSGSKLGLIGAVGFSAAIIQSYIWNRAWAFHGQKVRIITNAIRLFFVSALGAGAFAAVLTGAIAQAKPLYYLGILIIFFIAQLSLWKWFNLSLPENIKKAGAEFAMFLAVSLIGLLINVGLIAVISHFASPYLLKMMSADLIKNFAKACATMVSLIWNFAGYKLIVFRR